MYRAFHIGSILAAIIQVVAKIAITERLDYLDAVHHYPKMGTIVALKGTCMGLMPPWIISKGGKE